MLREGNGTKAGVQWADGPGYTTTVRFSRATSLTEGCTLSTGGCKKRQIMLQFSTRKGEKIHNQKGIRYIKITHKIRTGSNSAQQNTLPLFNGKPFCWGFILLCFVFLSFFFSFSLLRLPNGLLRQLLGTILEGPSKQAPYSFSWLLLFCFSVRAGLAGQAAEGSPEGQGRCPKMLLTLYN